MATLDSNSRTRRQEATVRSALRILEQTMQEYGVSFDSPAVTRDYLRLRLAHEEREVFACLFMNSQNKLIEYSAMFFGTLTQTAVYPREVLRKALRLNAGAIIIAHNHPGGKAAPSQGDKFLTKALSEAVALIDVRLLDHMIISNSETFSFAEHGLL